MDTAGTVACGNRPLARVLLHTNTALVQRRLLPQHHHHHTARFPTIRTLTPLLGGGGQLHPHVGSTPSTNALCPWVPSPRVARSARSVSRLHYRGTLKSTRYAGSADLKHPDSACYTWVCL